MIKLGTMYYDERNGRYISVSGVGRDPNCYYCNVWEMNFNGDYELIDSQNFMEGELKKFKEV